MKYIQEFIQTIAALRGPNGCPWDRKQDHSSLAGYLLEETHEVLDAIRAGDPTELKKELGDLLLQIVLHCQIASEKGQFDFEDVANSINAKMIERHPHVFTDETTLSTAKQVVDQWHIRKAKEAQAAGTKSAIDGVPNTMPALLQSLKISQKAAASGFEWENESQVWEQLESELIELKEAISESLTHETALELGDVLFTVVNIARWQDLNPEEALLLALNKFKARFRLMEELAKQNLSELSTSRLEQLWEQAKVLSSSTTQA
jgi:tetrapyrrole methylase family protein/MazG family protein